MRKLERLSTKEITLTVFLRSMLFLMALESSAMADLIIMNVGDSITAEHGARRVLQLYLDDAGIANDFVGDNTFAWPDADDINHQAFGGATFGHMLHGRTVDRGNGPQFEAGVADALTRYTPNTILLVGGYNNLVGEEVGAGLTATKAEFAELIDYLASKVPSVNVFVSNITDFDPAKQWGHKRQNVLDWNEYLADDVARRYMSGQRVYLVDNFSVETYDDLYPDGLHLLFSGQSKVGENWFAAITSVPESRTLPVLLTAFLSGMLVFRRPRISSPTEQRALS